MLLENQPSILSGKADVTWARLVVHKPATAAPRTWSGRR